MVCIATGLDITGFAKAHLNAGAQDVADTSQRYCTVEGLQPHQSQPPTLYFPLLSPLQSSILLRTTHSTTKRIKCSPAIFCSVIIATVCAVPAPKKWNHQSTSSTRTGGTEERAPTVLVALIATLPHHASFAHTPQATSQGPAFSRPFRKYRYCYGEL